ncbi:phosphatidate cytidylyltransferase [Streptomyces alkaliterrae]|uniref:Phosphatidate cytidylyltransferase n=1 Tax=Streptomyces alkaliterrae TaxID=2213162 RepID=A0A5P0YNX7_9ACTN|nr:phosphatidate cytidylyltransferase [Streptomyces alkaliterrae]MBB1252337.1 phosphatidate cytidylyltransferase [Streptomyces alkaliterrae]MBB1257233.1 phosphatidate cytidylyltransferase [Streptomyces alkaliterrae]MQS01948.1 phosphatidate cytidylyltransferase [Streptomyces alkaliterrae]
MNDSSWGASPSAGYRDPGDPGRSPSAGPVYEAADAAQTRPMPLPSEGVPSEGAGRDDDHTRRPAPADPPRDDRSRQSDSRQPETPSPGRKRAGRDLPAAIGVGLGLGAVIVASLFLVKEAFVAVVAAAVVVGLWELTSRLSERKGVNVPLVPLAVGGAAMVVAGYVRGAEGAWVLLALTALAMLLWRMAEPPENYLRDVTAGLFTLFYVPFLATFVALLLAADDGPWRVLTFLVLTIVSDTGAYAVGWRFGRRKLAPRISPGKTREGLLGAVASTMIAGALCMQFLIDGGQWWQGLLLGLAVAASATLGDLGESMIKRDLDIKDMGTLLPGHGGIMDRLDSLLPTAPVVWLLLVVFVGAG